MSSQELGRDPEIRELNSEIHDLTGQIKALVSEINKVTILLVAKVDKGSNERKTL